MNQPKKFRSIKDVYATGIPYDSEPEPDPDFKTLGKLYSENYMLQVTNLDGGEAVLSTEISPEKAAA